jgi:hypothetical protein
LPLPSGLDGVVEDLRPDDELAQRIFGLGARLRYGINRKIDIADLRENPVLPATAPGFIRESGMFDSHLWQPSSVAAYDRAVHKGKSGQVTARVWDYSRQIRILGYYAEYTETATANLNLR